MNIYRIKVSEIGSSAIWDVKDVSATTVRRAIDKIKLLRNQEIISIEAISRNYE